MKTRGPECQTVFRVTPEQLKARAGKVRCGHCQAVFNALDSLLETPAPPHPQDSATLVAAIPSAPKSETSSADGWETGDKGAVAIEPASDALSPVAGEEAAPPDDFLLTDFSVSPEVNPDGLVTPRDTTEIPGYSKWAEGVVSEAHIPAERKRPHWLFSLAAVLLILGLSGQAVFHFRSELAVSFPAAAPLLEAFSVTLGSHLPLPRHTDLVSIGTSDLQTDAARGNLLVLNATLRNRAPYAQDYPSLELSLTDTQDVAIARRVFSPQDYLPPKFAAEKAFPANADIPVRLWIEARELSPAGYRLYVFYP